MALLLAVPFPFVGMGGAMQGLLTHQRRYRALAVRTLIGQGAGMAVGISLAIGHAGAWALVVQQTTGSLLSAVVLICAAGWRPSAICRWSSVRSLLHIGLPLTASTLVQIGRYRIFAILIGGTAGASALGQIHVAFRLADTVRDIAFTALWRLLLPILSEHKNDGASRLRQVDRLLRLSSLGVLPLCGGLAVAVVPLTTLILGPAWQDAGVAAEPLVALTALLALMFPSGVALIAIGRARFTLYANLAGLAATVTFVLIVRPETPWTAVLVWCGAQMFISPYSLWMNARALDVGPFRPLRAGVPMLLATVTGVAAAFMIQADGALEALVQRSTVFVVVVAACAIPVLWSLHSKMYDALPPAAHDEGEPVEIKISF
jgi:PST family polysaccharide transporter